MNGSSRPSSTLSNYLEGQNSTLKGYWKYRGGDYRLVRDIQDRTKVVLVVAIGDRKDIYR